MSTTRAGPVTTGHHEGVGRRTNLALELLLVITLATGLAGFLSGSSGSRWLLVVHGTAGLAIVFLAPWKSTVARRGLRRARPDTAVSIAFALAVVIAIAAGVTHTTGLWVERGTWSPLGIHILAALVTVPFFVWHVAHRPQRPRPSDLSRRTLLGAGAITGAALAVRAVTRADHRFTGSFEVGSFQPEELPVVQWLNDSKPLIRPEDWLLRVDGETVTFDEIAAERDELVATLDCTGGWYSTQVWRGVSVGRLLGPDPGGRSLVVESATGYARRFPLGDRDRLLLATHLGGEPLSRQHGSPARLVAPGRRGLWWVKWVTSIQTSDRPWWLQSPIPLS